jgi:diadenosine tetraphosphate (Ap4A) HIT family hydrolase
MALSGIPYDDDNVFKKIIEGTVPSYKIFETEHALAFLDAFPMVKGHSLLVPKATGYASIIDMPEDVAANVLKELPRLARIVKSATGCDGVNIVQNNHACAGQVVFHVHFHVLPRWGPGNDGLVRLGKERGHDLGGCRHGAAPGHARHAVIA